MNLLDIASRIAALPYIVATRSAFSMTVVILIPGVAAFLLYSFPWDMVPSSIASLLAPWCRIFSGFLYNATFGTLSIFVCLGLAHTLGTQYNEKYPNDYVNPLCFVLVALGVVACAIGSQPDGKVALRWVGIHGLFLTFISSLLACFLFSRLLRIRKLRGTFFSDAFDNSFSQTLDILLPALGTLGFFAALNTTVRMAGISSSYELVYSLISAPFAGLGADSLDGALLYNFFRQLLWFFGLHGSNVLEPVMTEVYVAAQNALPSDPSLHGDTFFFTKTFFDCFTSIGGTGTTIGFIIPALFYYDDKGLRRILYLSIPPAIFNINELLLFGIPLILNPVLFIPFFITPIITTLISYAAMTTSIVQYSYGDVSWNIPILFNAFTTTGSISGVVLQIVCISVSILIYSPFIYIDNKSRLINAKKEFDKLIGLVLEEKKIENIMRYPGEIGCIARSLARDIPNAIENKEIFLVYQPQVNSDTGNVYGVESLVRWKHPNFGMVPPPVLIRLAEDSGNITTLVKWTFQTAAMQLRQWNEAGLRDISMSINISSVQLEDYGFSGMLKKIIREHGISHKDIKLEVTEENALSPKALKAGVLQQLNDMEIQIAIDDFGMGHSSIRYLKMLKVHGLKLDKILTKDIRSSVGSAEIISSISRLCQQLDIDMIAEFVETEEDLLKLRELGCHNIQGFYYSPPLLPQDAFDFIRKKHKAYGPH